MKCPHCLNGFHDKPSTYNIGEDPKARYQIKHQICPECKQVVVEFVSLFYHEPFAGFTSDRRIVYPKTVNRNPLDESIPSIYSSDYNEACAVLEISPKASAALSRRCLQNILRNVIQVTPGDLSKEIQQVIDKNALPSELLEDIDYIRNIGNFATHPNKDKSTGEIVDVEPGEAEWTISVLELMFDYLFVRPEIAKRKREELNAKLKGAGKPPMKS